MHAGSALHAPPTKLDAKTLRGEYQYTESAPRSSVVASCVMTNVSRRGIARTHPATRVWGSGRVCACEDAAHALAAVRSGKGGSGRGG